MRLVFAAAAFLLSAARCEYAAASETPVPSPAPVETRATLVAMVTEPGGATFVHLKIVPRAKLPFTTLRFRVLDRALLEGLQAGGSVKFRAARVDGENTLLAIRAVPACVRFQPCD